jgi:hypothetical protein
MRLLLWGSRWPSSWRFRSSARPAVRSASNEAERGLLVPALASVAFAALLFAAVHGRVSGAIARATGGDRAAPADLARSFSSRMSRAIPRRARAAGGRGLAFLLAAAIG